MRMKKILSVFLAAVMLFSVMSLGITGAAAEIDYDAQYRLLALALQNEHVRDLTNYTVSNVTLDNGTGGFDTEARGFAYDHRVTARDNAAGDILSAANRFYYIAENLMSYKYGQGCYDASTLLSYITEKIEPYFLATSGSGEKIYEDFYGNRYYPTPEEIVAYNKAVKDIEALGAQVSQATLTELGIYFMEMNDWEYYNVDAVLKYFVGNVLKINTGNWFHRFAFVVETSIDTILEESGGIDSIANPTLTLRTAVYQIEYQKEYNESMSKAYFSFAPPSLETVYQSFAQEFGWDTGESADLTKPDGLFPGLLRNGQASALMIKVSYDTTSVPYLQECTLAFDKYIMTPYDQATNTKWDSQFVSWSDDTVNNHPDTPVILGYAKDLTDYLSNEALQAVFGNRLGNMVTLAYLFKTSRSDPTRTVRGTATYTATAEKLDNIISDLDALVAPNEEETEDVKISNKVATVVSMFLDVGDLLGIEGEIDYSTLEDLIGKVLQQLVFSNSIVNMLVELLYPMIVNLLEDTLGSLTGVGFLDGAINDLLASVIKRNELAIYPHELADRIDADFPGQYTIATAILRNAKDNKWENVNFAGMDWGVDSAPIDQKSEYFLNALCAGLGGFTRLLVLFFCGDYEYRSDDIKDVDNFGKYFDLELLSGIWVASQGLYSKLFITLYRVLGLNENEFMSSEAYHAAVVKDRNVVLKNAVRPILTWVTEHVAKQPFATIMKLVPNLVHFLSRSGNGEYKSYVEDWSKDGFAQGFLGDRQGDIHKGFSTLQTESLYTIINNVYVFISIIGSSYNVGSIGGLVGDGTLGMLKSLNALLNEVIEFKYDTDDIASVNNACYSDANGVIVLPDSTEYALDPNRYNNAHTEYWSDASNTQFSLVEDEAHPFYHNNVTYVQKPYYIPAVPEAKLISCGEIDPATNTVKVDHPGLVFKFLLRYVLSALGYRYDLHQEGLPTVIECFGLDMESELFMGLTLGDIITNVMIHPDEALCALLELFYSNEEGDLYSGKPHTYPVTPIDYHEDVLLDRNINPTLTYGAEVKYSQYWTKEYARDFVSSLGPLVEDVLVMLGLEGMEDGLGGFLENLLNESVFTNDLINTLFNTVYQLLGGLNDSLGIDIEGILDAVLDVSFTPIKVARSIDKILGFETAASRAIKGINTWPELFDGGVTVDPITGEETPIIQDVELDWGLEGAEAFGISRADAFLRVISALFSPAAFAIKFLFMDQDLDILGLIHLPSYPAYNYAFIGLLEALSCPDILTYHEYYEASLDPDCGDAYTIYHLVSPILGLLEKVYESPVDTLLNLLPNLLFFISVGGLSDFVNNLIHFAYVLLDILKPILNAYDLLEGLLANIDLGGLSLNLALPLDLDVNSLISDLLGTLVGDVLTIEGVSLHLPYIDLYTICVGTLEPFMSKEQRSVVHLSPAGGGELLTALLRIVFEVLFMEENHRALSEIIANLAEEGRLDEYDEETLYMVINGLIGLIEEYEILDMVLFAVYKLITVLVPIADTLAPRFQANGMTITDLIDSASDMDLFMANLQLIMKDPNEVEVPDTTPDVNAITSLLDRIKAFFEKIKLFFQQLFNFG